MTWQKLGRLFEPVPVHPRLLTHAANPVAVPLRDGVFRVYYNGRDHRRRSSVGYIEIDLRQRAVLRVQASPVFSFSDDNGFFSHGVSLGNTYQHEGKTFLSFMGWHQPREGHWRGEIGCLRIEADGKLSLVDREPMLKIDASDPLSLSYPWVMSLASGDLGMWYGSTETWSGSNDEMLHPLKFATSKNGRDWQKQGVVLATDAQTAQAFSRPCVVLQDSGAYEMWVSWRGAKSKEYAIGLATSDDVKAWHWQQGRSGPARSTTGWDDQMVEYPFVFAYQNEQYMLYNGNDFGRTGFGLAIKDQTTRTGNSEQKRPGR